MDDGKFLAMTYGSEGKVTDPRPTTYTAMGEREVVSVEPAKEPGQALYEALDTWQPWNLCGGAIKGEYAKREKAVLEAAGVERLRVERNRLGNRAIEQLHRAEKAERERDEWKAKAETLENSGHRALAAIRMECYRAAAEALTVALDAAPKAPEQPQPSPIEQSIIDLNEAVARLGWGQPAIAKLVRLVRERHGVKS